MDLLILISILVLIIIINICIECILSTTTQCYEGYGGGALTQLMAKGPQDTYLSADANKYVPEYGAGRYYATWNFPTRLTNYYYRYPYFFPDFFPYVIPYYLY